MQISRIEVTPVQLKLRLPFRTAAHPEPVTQIDVIFLRAELVRDYGNAWGCAVLDPFSGPTLEQARRVCRDCADRLKDLNPLSTQYALAELSGLMSGFPAVQCACDTILHDLLGLSSGLPLYRLLGG